MGTDFNSLRLLFFAEKFFHADFADYFYLIAKPKYQPDLLNLRAKKLSDLATLREIDYYSLHNEKIN